MTSAGCVDVLAWVGGAGLIAAIAWVWIDTQRKLDALLGEATADLDRAVEDDGPDEPEAAPVLDPGDFERFLRGDPDVDPEEVRHFARVTVRGAQRLGNAYDEAADMAGLFAKQWSELGGGLFGEWHPDPFVRGVLHGEGYCAARASSAFSLLGNAMRARAAIAERATQRDADSEPGEDGCEHE